MAGAVALAGFLLLNAAFIADFLFQTAVLKVVGLFTPVELRGGSPVPLLLHLAFAALTGWLSIYVFRSKLNTYMKASWLMVPLAVVYVTIGIFTYKTPALSYMLTTAFGSGVFLYLVRTHQPWPYVWAFFLLSIALLVSNLLGMEI